MAWNKELLHFTKKVIRNYHKKDIKMWDSGQKFIIFLETVIDHQIDIAAVKRQTIGANKGTEGRSQKNSLRYNLLSPSKKDQS